MARSKNLITQPDRVDIQKAIETSLGKKVLQQSDCIILALEIQNKTGIRISDQTLRRFFGLIKHTSSISLSSLNVLAQYVGFDDWITFTTRKRTKVKQLSRDEILFIKDFYNTSIEQPADINFYQASSVIAQKIIYSGYSEKLLKELALNKTSQKYFYEMFPCVDDLGGIYHLGIKEYLKNKKITEAKIFAHSLLFLRAFLIQNNIELVKEFSSLFKSEINFSLHPLPVARYAGSHLLYYYISNDKKEYQDWLNKCVVSYAEKYNENNIQSDYFPGYHLMMIDYLLLTEEFENANLLLIKQEQLRLKIHSIYASHISNIEVAKLHKAIIMAYTNQEAISKKILKQIKIENIWIFEKKYYSIWYLLLQLHFSNSINKKKKLILQVERLIIETKFIYFNKFLKQYL